MTATPLAAPQALSAWLAEVARFPLKPWLRSLILAAALISGAVSVGLTILPPILAGLVALITMVTLWVLTLRVASRILLATADGAGLEREYREFDLPEYQAARQIAVWLLIAIILAMLNQVLGTAGLLLGLVGATLVLPALTMLVALNNTLESCLKRQSWGELNRQLDGLTYRRLSGLFMLMALIYLMLDRMIGVILPVPLATGVMMAAWVYAVWVWFFALGGALRLIRRASPPADSPVAESTQELAKRLGESGGTLDEHRRLIRALEQNGDQAGLLRHGPGYVSALLLAYERVLEAVERADALVALDPDFALDLPSSQLKLIEAARAHGHPGLVINLVSAYLKAWPAAPGGREARLIACEVEASSAGRRAHAWFRELIHEQLDEAEQSRVKVIADIYLKT